MHKPLIYQLTKKSINVKQANALTSKKLEVGLYKAH